MKNEKNKHTRIYSTSKLELFSLKIGCHLLCVSLESTWSTWSSTTTFGKDAWATTNIFLLTSHSDLEFLKVKTNVNWRTSLCHARAPSRLRTHCTHSRADQGRGAQGTGVERAVKKVRQGEETGRKICLNVCVLGDAVNHPIIFSRDLEKPSLWLQLPAAKSEEWKRSGERLKPNVAGHKQGKGGKIKRDPRSPKAKPWNSLFWSIPWKGPFFLIRFFSCASPLALFYLLPITSHVKSLISWSDWSQRKTCAQACRRGRCEAPKFQLERSHRGAPGGVQALEYPIKKIT